MAQSIQGGSGEQSVGREGLIPLGEIEIAGDDGRRLLVAFGDQVMEVFIGRRAHGFESKVVNDQQRNPGQRGDFAFDRTDRPRRGQAGTQLSLRRKKHIDALAYGAMAERLGQMAFAGAAGADDEHGRLLLQIAPGRQIMDQGSIQIRQAREIKAFKRLAGAESGAAQA